MSGIRVYDLDTGWLFQAHKAPDLVVELEWCHARNLWLQGIGAGGGPAPVLTTVPHLPAPDGFSEDERRQDAYRIATGHLRTLGAT